MIDMLIEWVWAVLFAVVITSSIIGILMILGVL